MRRAGGMEIDCIAHTDMSSIYIDVIYRGQGVRRKEKGKGNGKQSHSVHPQKKQISIQ